MFRNSKQVGKVAKARGLARAAVIAGVIVAGAGYLVSTSLGSEGGNPTYCDFSYSGPAISCGNVIKFDPLTATAYVCVPCPPEVAPCNTGGAANYVNKMCPGANTAANMFGTYAGPDCGSCKPPSAYE